MSVLSLDVSLSQLDTKKNLRNVQNLLSQHFRVLTTNKPRCPICMQSRRPRKTTGVSHLAWSDVCHI